MLTFRFRPKLLTLGIGGSCAAVAGFLALFVMAIVSFRRRRRAAPAASAHMPPASGSGQLSGKGDPSR
jgi:hypothetical protein